MSNPDDHSTATHWLQKPSTTRKLWVLFAVLLAASVLAQSLVHHHAYFGVDGWFGFNAVFGLVSCVAMVLFAKVLGMILKRAEDYYQADVEDHDA